MRTLLWVVASTLLVPGAGAQEGPAGRPDPKAWDAQVRPFLAKHCTECHSAEKPKGKFRIDQLDAAFSSRAAEDRWLAVREQITTGAMPPKAKPRPAKADIDAVAA